MFALLIVQADTGWLTFYRRDATVRNVGVGWRDLAVRDRSAAKTHRRNPRARAGLRHHELACVLSAARHLTSAQQSQRIRWVNTREPDAAQLAGPLLYVDEVKPRAQIFFKDTFGAIEDVAELPRKRVRSPSKPTPSRRSSTAALQAFHCLPDLAELLRPLFVGYDPRETRSRLSRGENRFALFRIMPYAAGWAIGWVVGAIVCECWNSRTIRQY